MNKLITKKKINTTIALPDGCKLLVKVGEGVDRGQFLAEGVSSPVQAKVKEITSNSISLTFWAFEVEVEEVVSGRVWGEGNLELIDSIKLINSSMVGRILFASNLDSASLMKMVVMGVVAVIVVSDKEYVLPFSLKVNMPIGWISKTAFEKLVNKFGKNDDNQMLFNSGTGRLLVVVK